MGWERKGADVEMPVFRKYELGNAMSKNNVRRNPTMCDGILTSGTPGRALRVVARASANQPCF